MKTTSYRTIFVLAAVVILCGIYLFATFVPNLFYRPKIQLNKIKEYEIVAHRGGSLLGLENSMDCIEAGLNCGVDAVEIDVHRSVDGEWVVCHDATINRTTNGKGRIDAMTWHQLKNFNLVDHRGRPTEQRLPLLREVINQVRDRAELLIEVKSRGGDVSLISKSLVDLLEKENVKNGVVIQSFDDDVLEELHRLAPSLRLEKLVRAKLPGLPIIVDRGLSFFSSEKYDYVKGFNVYYLALTPSLIRQCHCWGKCVKTWTVNSPLNLPSSEVDGVITDHPDAFIELYSGK